MRQWLLRNPWVRPMCVFNYAAIKIQQHIRGCLQRKQRNGTKRIVITESRKKKLSNRQLDKYLTYLDRFKDQKRRRKPLWLDEGYSSWCAVRIQSFFRMHQVRKRYVFKKKLVNQVAAIIIQTAWRNCVYRAKIAAMMNVRPSATLDVFIAAEMIQLCWRSFCNRRIYRYFRDLVTKNLKGAPFDLLRSIIPTEAHVLDRASGVHVRFRLGGRVYPPKVYFKIYTHRPLCDVNSFAPRNYVLEKPADPAQVLNRSSTIAPKTTTKQAQAIRVGARYFGAVVSTTSAMGTKDWYKRDEKNDWRPIASHMFDSVVAPPWYRDPAHTSKPKPFHFSKLRREEDIRLARKKRRRQWLVKAYLLSTTGTINPSASAKSLNFEYAGQKDDDRRGQYAADEKEGSDSRYDSADAKFAPDGRTITNNYRQLIVKPLHGIPTAESKYEFEDKSSYIGNGDARSAAADFKRSFGANYERGNDQRSVGSASLQLHSRGMMNASESLLHSKMSNVAPFKENNHNYSTAQKLLRTSYALDEQSISTAGSRVKTNTLTNAQQLVGGNISYGNQSRRPQVQAQSQAASGQVNGAQSRRRFDADADQYVDLVDWR